jgi:hypothetical protein
MRMNRLGISGTEQLGALRSSGAPGAHVKCDWNTQLHACKCIHALPQSLYLSSECFIAKQHLVDALQVSHFILEIFTVVYLRNSDVRRGTLRHESGYMHHIHDFNVRERN